MMYVLTKGFRRLARRGGVKRISASIYDEIRAALKARLETVRRAYYLLTPKMAANIYLDSAGLCDLR